MKVCKEIRKEEEDEEEEEEETPQSDKATGKLQMREMFYEFMKVIQNSDEVKTLLIKQNEELKKQLATTNTLTNTNTNNTNSNNSNNTNSNNNQFNLQFFLNEQCKDALNIMDFVNSLDIQVSDLEETGKLGFIGGITRIFANGLKELDICKRPIHCTDLKRETLYVKSDDTWEKEEDGNPRLKKAVTRVSNLNFKQLKKWQELNPGYDIVDTAKNDEFIHLSTQAIGSCSTQETDRNIDKIMKNLCKQVVLDKKEGALRVM
jgi:translation initiation factor 1 (eIF-1/SUI1)